MFEESLGLLQAFQCLFTVYPFQQNIVFSFSREEWFAEYFWGPTSRGCPALYEDRPHERLVASKLRQDSLPGEPSMADCSFSMSLVKVITKGSQRHILKSTAKNVATKPPNTPRWSTVCLPSKVHIGSPEIRIQEQASTPQQWTENKTQTCETCEVSSNAATEDGMEMDSKNGASLDPQNLIKIVVLCI